MSNKVTIEPTVFRSVRSGIKSLGYRAYDDYSSSYCNIWDNIPDDDLEVLDRVIRDADDTVRAMLDYVKEGEHGLSIGDEWYEWDQIKHLWNNSANAPAV